MNNRNFFGGNFFEMLCNLYYFQNQGKYDSSSKVLACVDVSVVCATPQRGMFLEVSQPQALQGALISAS
jgi:hypothetical protein